MTAEPGDRRPAIVTAARAVDRDSLAERAEAVRARLAPSVTAGASLGIWIEDAIDLAAAVIGTLAARVEAFLIPPDVTPSRVVDLCAIEGASTVLCDAARATRLVDGPRRAGGSELVLVDIPPQQRLGSSQHDHPDGALHFFTSGTDGRPKGVVRTKLSLDLEATTIGAHLGLVQGSAVLCAAPVTHAYGFVVGLFAPLAAGATAIVDAPRLAASLAAVLTMHEPEVVVAVPAQYAAWSALRRAYDGPMPRWWVSSGAPLPASVRDRFEAAWSVSIVEQYGMTECGAVAIDLDGYETLGRPYPGVSLVIASADAAAPLGEVVVDTPYGACCYVGATADVTASRFTPEGFRTGDTGWLDPHGRLHLLGRRAHQLNVRGLQVDPDEVERAFWALDDVRDVAVVGVDRATGDQWIAAFVVGADRITDDALERATADLEGFQRPQLVTRLSALPKTATGKTDRTALEAMASVGADLRDSQSTDPLTTIERNGDDPAR